jgi:L-ascorbate metabolism protein UlaG (beta-lactamase superfamily)
VSSGPGRRPALGLVAALLLVAGCAGVDGPVAGAPAHHRARGFVNGEAGHAPASAWTRVRFFASRVLATTFSPRSVSLPRVDNDGAALRANRDGATVTWVGHATLLVQLDGINLLTDPIWSDRASPVSFAGPRRLNPPGLRFEDLPPIHAVVISHDHYDSLDVETLKRLVREHRPRFLVPLGLAAWFADLGIGGVEELDWWQARPVGRLTITCVPAQHFSGRTPWDRDRRLWSGWVVSGSKRLYFAGDSAYFSGFARIAERLGPFDLAALPIGAYLPPEIMRPVHITPEEALQAFQDVGARHMVAIHWGTFDLAEEPLDDPPRRLAAEMARRGLGVERVWVLRHGETRSW